MDSVRAVLTADIVNSTRLAPDIWEKLMAALWKILQPYLSEFFRGDSFQVYLKEPGKGLRVALLCRSAAMSLTANDQPPVSDVRISIGIGPVEEPVKKPGSAKGPAFLLSGHAFDALQGTPARLAIVSENKIANTGLEVIADHLNSIFNDMTVKQAEVIYKLLDGETQQSIAGDLQKSRSTISQIASSGKWAAIEKLLEQYENLINQLI